MERCICIHGHFYQPPRENPWLEAIEMQDSAFPYHDWNERISSECYEPNAASRILDSESRIIGIMNNYSKISFNFGPTLLSWMEKFHPEVYGAILEADRLSTRRFSGHGAAIAQVYNHVIMPLANDRDRVTQIRWGIQDFEHRFGRKPEGMWLAETAVDTPTLESLVEHGLTFTVLSPFQAARVRKIGEKGWKDVTGGRIDSRRPYVCSLPSGGRITLFFYDGQISHDLSFGNLLTDGMNFAARLMSAFSDTDEPQLVHTATDGETFGHHHRFGDMALAYCLHLIESEKKAVITVYGEYLEKHPPAHEVKILESTSWSCSHGVERWRGNCGCSTGMHPGWTQAWRAPLRNAMDWLRDSIVPLYEREMSGLIKDPWAARNDYIGVILDRSSESLEAFFQSHAERDLPGEERTQALKLLEMQRHALLMYTSCGWFFDELSGIETTQVIQFADRAVQLAEETSGVRLEEEFVRRISEAPSNLPELGDGGRVYELYVKPARVNLLRVAAHYAISSLFEEYPQTATIHCYAAESLKYARQEMGLLRLATGKARITSVIVGESALVSFAVLHLGDHNMNGGVREFMDDEGFASMEKSIGEPFLKGDVPITIRKMDEIFGSESYSLRDLFKDEQRKVLREVLEPHIDRIENSLFQLYDGFYPIMQVMREQNIPLPAAFSDTGRFIVNAKLKNLLVADGTDLEEMRTVITAMKRFSFPVNRDEIGYVASGKITALMERLRKNPMDLEIVETTSMLLQSLTELDLTLELWRAQNIFFDICLEHRPAFKERTETGETGARNWLEIYDELGSYLMVRCD
jgi:alpha-amylase/alpha-mannosidase (GH57 family)